MKKIAPALLLSAIGALAATSAHATTDMTVTIKNETGLHGSAHPGTINSTYCNKSDATLNPCPALPNNLNQNGGSGVAIYKYTTIPAGTSYAQNDVWASYQVAGGGTCQYFFRVSRNVLGKWGFNTASATPTAGGGFTPVCSWSAGTVDTTTGAVAISFIFYQ